MPTPEFSSNVAQLEASPTLALAARARKLKADGVDVVDLSAGEPQYPAPAYAARAGIRAVEEGKTGYPPTAGLPELRDAIARYLRETTASATVDPASVIVGAGVKQALFNCCYALFEPGHEVLVPAPYWPSYPAIVGLSGAEPVVIDTGWDTAFLPSVEDLEAARTPHTRGLMLNSPGNPTGAVIPGDLLRDILMWADRHGIWVLSDEIYRRLSYDGPAPSVFDVAERGERTVLLDGLSKAFCMPGFRIGYAVGPPDLVRKMSDLQGQTTSGAVGPSQYSAAAALGESGAREAFVADLVSKLARLRDLGLTAFNGIGAIEAKPPDGALYFYGRLADPAASSLAVAEQLLVEASVACMPGEPFGSPGYLRFNFAVEPEVLEEGMTRLADFFG
ncbi:pyridoxal phosphate-dependent aminotransferase [Candidatus Palauibacter sp.]|uniref:pyridoxal phosphate-dependent aminotransferase n=1 Tax=Candidatus Palauibacter sp. TaxID=3101350 RepID=UPI003AF28F9A